ncbi:DUF222 domain-containing protein [Amnibacterium flavum]|nr:HNH endonuclease signature motif containing protein [Amnibacterium flavum]
MESTTTRRLAEQAARLDVRVESLRGIVSGSTVETLMSASDADLLDCTAEAIEVLRLAEAPVSAGIGEIARRSESTLPDPLARRLGEKSAASLIATRTRMPRAEAARFAQLGLSLTPREGLTGEILPPFFARVADTLADGAIGATAARTIVATLEHVEPHATLDDLEILEKALVHGASEQWSAQTLRDVCVEVQDRFDSDADLEARERASHERRFARETVRADGGSDWHLRSDAEGSPYIRAAIDMLIAPRRQPRFSDEDSAEPADDATADKRTMDQRRADAFRTLAQMALRSDDGELGGVDTTVVIHVTEAVATGDVQAEEEESREPDSAWIEGTEVAISGKTARRLAQNAEFVRLTVDFNGQPLRLGRTKRFFNRPQRRAMAARDGGCIWPDCDAPPRRCDAAHITPWSAGGPTDIDNGALLCHFHHRRFDEDGWLLQFIDGIPWFTPPPHVDSTRTPRQGGNRRRLAQQARRS